MQDLKPIIAKNITRLRTDNEMTQAALAQKLNYSDKAVSKWERGESVPDIAVLNEIAVLFGVTVDYLISEEHPESNLGEFIEGQEDETEQEVGLCDHKTVRRHGFIAGLGILLVWLVATLAFVLVELILPPKSVNYLPFLYAVPVSMIVWLVFNSLWFNKRRNYLIISLLMWSVLASFELTFLIPGFNIWRIFLLGIPGQAIIFMWSRIGSKK